MRMRKHPSPFVVGQRVKIVAPAIVAQDGDKLGTIRIAGPSCSSVDVDGDGETAIANCCLVAVEKRYAVKPNGRCFDVIDATTGEVVEGGFFGHSAAELAATEWNEEAR